MEMQFGIPTIRTKKVEKYESTPVMTLSSIEKEGSSRKISFNKKALELLEVKLGEPHRISFSFTGDKVYVVNTISGGEIPGLTLGKGTPAVSNKKYYDQIKKTLNLLENEEYELSLQDEGKKFGDKIVFSVIPMELQSITQEVSEMEVIDEEVIETEQESHMRLVSEMAIEENDSF